MNDQNIKHIASYEIKTLTRDWGFKCITLVSILLVVLLHVIAQSNLKHPTWVAISLPSAIPFANAYIVNYLQVFIAIFWAGRFAQKEQHSDTSSSIWIRPFTNADLIWGKTLGFMLVLFGLDVLLGVVAILIHLCISDSPFALYPYLFYLFSLTLPTLIFTTGLVVCVKGVIRNQALSLLILLVFFFFEIMHGTLFFHGATNLFTRSLPNVFSDVTGFLDLDIYLEQRSIFLLWGCGLLVLGIRAVKRLPNNSQVQPKTIIFGVGILLLGLVPFWKYENTFIQTQQDREIAQATFIKYEDTLKARISNHDISFEQNGKSYLAVSLLTIFNPNKQTLPSIILYLNPGLSISSITLENKSLKFERDQQVVVIDYPLQSKERKDIKIQYHGSIFPQVCYTEMNDLQAQAEARSYYIFNMGSKFFYLQPDFTLLTPECLWYPSSLPPVSVHSPHITPQAYTHFQLTIIGEKNRLPISQGISHTQGDTIRFTNKERQTGLSLCIGNYTRKSISVDSTLYEMYLFKGHEYLAEQFVDPKEIINGWVQSLNYSNQKYAFKKLAFVETPIHFCAYSRLWKDRSEYIQPEIIFRPEREALLPYAFKVKDVSINEGITTPQMECFSIYKKTYSKTRNVLTGNLFMDALSRRIKKKDIKNEYETSSLLQDHHLYITSSEFPGIDLIFRKMLDKLATVYNSFGNQITFSYAIEYLTNHSLENALQNPKDNIQFQQILWAKSDDLSRRILCFVPYQEFYNFTKGFVTRNSFQEASYEEYCEEFKKQFKIDLIAITRQFYTERDLPSFLVKDAQIQWVEKTNGEIGYVQSVKVWNRGKVDGTITLSGSHLQEDIHWLIPAGTCKEIRNYFADRPEQFGLEVITGLAQNMPSYYSYDIKINEKIINDPFPGIFDTDTAQFLPSQGEYIVDNRDSGFRIIESAEVLKKLLREKKGSPNDNNLQRWTYKYGDEAYGEPVRDYHSKISGNGSSRIEWETQLPEAGVYELFVYNDEFIVKNNASIKRFVNKKEIITKAPIQTYQFSHKNGEEEITLETSDVGNGWISLGKFQFVAGLAKITLLDRGADSYQAILADAVKWVKIKS